eukprot:TRINITY_DN17690_c0_g1_i3.p1 TRINITY_DN17690_c0_g1~~TRINITY_DN17690_c0_g1_i3.p1  ORF type:complete len:385 (-),score=57.38 TRINITY_DN17690_c0_g1_i3:374-1408(-)
MALLPPSNSSSAQDRCTGLLLGLAGGDRNGGPIRMAVRLGESLVSCRTFEVSDVFNRYHAWYMGPPYDEEKAFDTGVVFASVFRHFENGMPLAEAVQKVFKQTHSAGVNPAHRGVVLAMARFLPDLNLDETADSLGAEVSSSSSSASSSSSSSSLSLPTAVHLECNLTHGHPISFHVALATTLLCRALLEGQDWASAVLSTTRRMTHPVLYQVFASIWHHLALQSTDLPSPPPPLSSNNPDDSSACDAEEWPPVTDRGDLDQGGFAPRVLQAALYFVSTSPDYGTALSRSLNFAGQANFCPVLVGAFAGARFGKGQIRKLHLAHLGAALLQRVERCAEELAREW